MKYTIIWLISLVLVSCTNPSNTNTTNIENINTTKQEIKTILPDVTTIHSAPGVNTETTNLESSSTIDDNELSQLDKQTKDPWFSMSLFPDVDSWSISPPKHIDVKSKSIDNIRKQLNEIRQQQSSQTWVILSQTWVTSSQTWVTLTGSISQKEESNKTLFKYMTVWFKDELYSYRKILQSSHNGTYRVIDYSEKIDIEDRDEIDVDKVYDKYIDYSVDKYKQLITNWVINYYQVTDPQVSKSEKQYVLLYFHWAWWNKWQWVNNITFWGNFNRVQNLSVLNKWVYITIDVDWSKQWVNNVWLLLQQLHTTYPNAKIILSAGSKWWEMIWSLLSSSYNVLINGVIFIGSVLDSSNSSYTSKFLINNHIPIYIWHWSKDFIPYKEKLVFLEDIEQQWGIIQVDIFNWWVHWTPIRMINWRDVLEWILINSKTQSK